MKLDSRDATRLSSSKSTHRAASFFVWFIIAVCCVLPLGWLVFQIVAQSRHACQKHDSIRSALRCSAERFSTAAPLRSSRRLLALPAAWVLGRGADRALLLWFLLPISLLMPSLVLAYGWKQFFCC